MPRAFDKREKEWIRNRLIEEGRKLFEKYGFKKTSIDEIVRNVGISKGSFYLFYNSKEELLFDIIEKIEREFKEKIFSEVIATEKNPKEILRKLFLNLFDFLENTAILRQISGMEIGVLIRKIPKEKIINHMNEDIRQILNFISFYQERGFFLKRDMDGFIGFLKLMPYLIIHKDEFSKDEFKAVKEFIIDMVVNYFTKED